MKIDYQQELNAEQYKVVCQADGPCLVLAGAGSGKTRTVTYRVAYLLEKGVDPARILLLTFTNKAAHEMKDRITGLIGQGSRGMWGGTFHHIANRLLRQYAGVFGFQSNFTILDGEDAKDLVTATIHSLDLGGQGKKFPSGGIVQEMISFARNAIRPLEEVVEMKNPRFLEYADALNEVMKDYQTRKQAQNTMDFDDLLHYTRQLLQTPSGEAVAKRFDYVIVDEYQDTNSIQGEIVKLFAAHSGNVLVVGDDAQSIYSFRAANIRNILDFPKLFGGTGKKSQAKVFKLETNYRSTPEILRFANTIIKQNVDQHSKELKSVRQPYLKPLLYPFDDQRAEASFVAQAIVDRKRTGTPLEQQAVLFRSTFHAQQLEMELAKRGVPYDFRGGLKFFERAHIKDALAFLRVVSNPKEEVSWLRLLSMHAGIGPATASSIYKFVSALTEVDRVTQMGLPPTVGGARATVGWDQFQKIMREILSVKERTPEALILAVLASDYQDIMESKWPNWRDRAQDIEQLAVFARGATDLSKFLSELALEEQMSQQRDKLAKAGKEGKVVLSTVHQAKGLEWDVVYILNVAEGSFPNRRALKEDGGTEEERRLLYVASTRARRELLLTYPLTSTFDATQINRASSFLEPCGKDILERVPYGGSTNSLRNRASEDDVIELDANGERTVAIARPSRKRGSFLPEVDEL